MRHGLFIFCVLGFLGLGLAGCTGPYHAYDNYSGYTDAPVGKATYEIAYVGKAGAPELEVRNFATIRAADLTTQNGARYFEILKTEYKERQSLALIPGRTYVYNSLYGPCYYGGPAIVASTPGYVTEIQQPVVKLRIVLRRSPNSKTLDAWRILDNAAQQGLVKRETG